MGNSTLTAEATAPKSKRPVTTKDVAALANVDRASVSVVLNGAKSSLTVSAETRSRIIEAADKLGYRRNGMAARIQGGRFGAVALLLSSHPNASTLPMRVFEGIDSELEKHGMHLIVHKLPMDTLSDPAKLPKVLTEWTCDGLIVDLTHAIPSHMLASIEKSDIPSIWMNVPKECDAVRPDDYGAGRQAAQHLLNMGHRRIAYLDLSHTWEDICVRDLSAPEHYSAHDRFAGVRDTMQAAGVELATRFRDESISQHQTAGRHNAYVHSVQQLLKEHQPTAIISYGDSTYATPIAVMDLKMEIPRDLSIMAFGHAPTWVMDHHVTLMAVPEFHIGQELVRRLLRKIEDPTIKLPSAVLPFELDEGSTCAPPPRRGT